MIFDKLKWAIKEKIGPSFCNTCVICNPTHPDKNETCKYHRDYLDYMNAKVLLVYKEIMEELFKEMGPNCLRQEYSLEYMSKLLERGYDIESAKYFMAIYEENFDKWFIKNEVKE